jgi:hypothetical protein
MKKLEFKRDPMVIVPYTLFTLALLIFFAMKKISWVECVAGLAFLNVPAVFGLAKGGTSNGIAILLAGALAIGVTACGYGKPACAVVDVAKANCDLWIRYLAEDGTTREVRLSPQEATDLARVTAKKRAAERDGGAP